MASWLGNWWLASIGAVWWCLSFGGRRFRGGLGTISESQGRVPTFGIDKIPADGYVDVVCSDTELRSELRRGIC
jgi:hypothetical protein